jgi:hypothetical protein
VASDEEPHEQQPGDEPTHVCPPRHRRC